MAQKKIGEATTDTTIKNVNVGKVETQKVTSNSSTGTGTTGGGTTTSSGGTGSQPDNGNTADPGAGGQPAVNNGSPASPQTQPPVVSGVEGGDQDAQPDAQTQPGSQGQQTNQPNNNQPKGPEEGKTNGKTMTPAEKEQYLNDPGAIGSVRNSETLDALGNPAITHGGFESHGDFGPAAGAPGETSTAGLGTDAAGAGAKTAEAIETNAARTAATTAAGGAAAAGEEAAALAETTAATGGTCWIVFAVLIVIFLFVVLIFGMIACNAEKGYFGQSNPTPSGKNYKNVATVLASSTKTATGFSGNNISGYNNLQITPIDKKFIQDGLADKRLLDALKYLSDKHASLGISHIIDGYQEKTVNPESGTARDPQIASTTSSHAKGLSADISTIDFVYKVDEESQMCQDLAAAACGPFAPACKTLVKQIKLGDLVYYSDKDDKTATTATSLDPEAINTKIELQKAVLDETKASINQSKQQIENLKNQLESAQITLEAKQADGSLTTEQRTSLQAKVQNIKDIIARVNTLTEKVNSFNQQINSFSQKILDLQQKLVQLKENLKKVQAIAKQVGASNQIGGIINDINTMTDKVLTGLDPVSTQMANLGNVVTNISKTLSTNVQNLTNAVDQNNSDINGYLTSIDQAAGPLSADINTDSLNSIENSLPNLDGFTNAIDSLIQKTANAALEQITQELKDQMQKAIDEQLNKALGNLGLGFLGDKSLLRLPCMGFVIPTVSSIAGNSLNLGSINGYDISKLSQDIVGNIDKVTAQISKTSTQLNNISTQVSTNTQKLNTQIQNFSNTMAKNTQNLQKAVNQTNTDTKTYLGEIDKNIGLFEAVSNPGDIINQYKTTLDGFGGQLSTIGQGAIGNITSQATTSASNVNNVTPENAKQTIEAQKIIFTQSKTSTDQIKTQTTDLIDKLNQTKITLQAKSTNQSLTNTDRAKIQAQMAKVQSVIDQANAFKNQLDTYKQQIDTINQKFTEAQAGLDQVVTGLSTLKSVINQTNNIPGKLDGLVAKFIPKAMVPYAVVPNTKYKDNANTQAVPIKVKWQDDKPDAVYVSKEEDDKKSINPLIYYAVYQPEARRKTHLLIEEALQYPIDMKDKYYYSIIQLITFSDERDVQPFADKLKELYGLPRPANLGLFAMPESWAQVHISY